MTDCGVTLEWTDIRVKVHPPGPSLMTRLLRTSKSQDIEPKSLLHGISGRVNPGTLLAILGASGAGKTTLLNTLSKRNSRSLLVDGQIKINGQIAHEGMPTESAYIQQEQLFVGLMTVREHLMFQASLRMQRSISYEDRVKRVKDIILQLGLSECADTLIGVPGQMRGISGGEKRRLMFASEMLTDPKLLFADEPTSGLDSLMALNVISVLQELAAGGKTVLCTIHQPSSEVYDMFDNVLLMAEGKIAYMGSRNDAIPFFQELGYECPAEYNPADYFISELAIVPDDEENRKSRIKTITDAYEKSNFAIRLKENRCCEDHQTVIVKNTQQTYTATWIQQFKAVLWRSFLTLIREPSLTKYRIIQTICTSLLAGLIYLQIQYDQEALQNVAGALFFLLTDISFSSIFVVLDTFILEIPVFLREHRNRMYRTDVYFLAKNLVELPYSIVLPFLYSTIFYWMVGLNPNILRFLAFYAIAALVMSVSVSYGYLISCLSKSAVIANALSPLFTLPIMLFGGFFVRKGSEPVYLVWIRYISWFSYSFEAMSINQWETFGNLTCDLNLSTCFKNGPDILEFYNFQPVDIYFDIGMLIMFALAWRALAFIILLIRTSLAKQV